jgi:hypothetical protein
MSDVLRKIFGVKAVPDVPGLTPIRDDRTAGFVDGVESVLSWLRSLPKIEMPTHDPNVVSIHDMSALEAAIHLEEKLEAAKSA